MRLRLLKGDISRVSANAIVTSANDALCGNDHEPCGALTATRHRRSCSPVDDPPAQRRRRRAQNSRPRPPRRRLSLPEIKPVVHENEEPRDISRWAETAKKRGLSRTFAVRAAAPSRRAPTAWTRTRAAVAPDSEFGAKGTTKGILAYEARTCARRRRRRLERLHATYVNAFKVCSTKDARTVALRCYVKAWRRTFHWRVRVRLRRTSMAARRTRPWWRSRAPSARSSAKAEDHAFGPGLLRAGVGRAGARAARAAAKQRLRGDHWNPSDAGWRDGHPVAYRWRCRSFVLKIVT